MNPACMSERRSATAAGAPHRPVPAGAHPLAMLALAISFTALLAIPTGASARSFVIEIIVFDDLSGEGLHTEHWPADPGRPSLRDAVELVRPPEGGPGEAARAYRLVNRSALALDGVRRSLRRSARYRPFLHLGWRLPALSHGAARPVRIGPHLGERGTGGPGSDGGERPAVQGTVKVSLARYLHVELDLVYSRPGNDAIDTPNAGPAGYRLVSERRMRSGELHYIDHPLFGVLVLIEPLRATSRSARQFPPTVVAERIRVSGG